MEIKRISEESFESVNQYLQAVFEYVENFADLHFIDYQNVRYMALSYNTATVLVFKQEESFKVVIVELEKGQISRLIYNDNLYTFEENIVNRKNIDGTLIEQIIADIENELGISEVIYKRYDKEKDKMINLEYNITPYREYAATVIKNISLYIPDIVCVEKRISLFNHKILSKRQTFCLVKEQYYQVYMTTKNMLHYNPFIGINKETLLAQIEEERLEVPKELASLISNTNEEINTLKLVAEGYQNYIKGQ